MKRTFYDPLYNRKILLFYGCPNEAYIKAIRKISADDPGLPDKGAAGMYYAFTEKNTDSKRYSIWIDRAPRRLRDMGTLCHEVFHLTVDILKDSGVRWGNGASEEAFTYLFEALVDKILEKMGVQ